MRILNLLRGFSTGSLSNALTGYVCVYGSAVSTNEVCNNKTSTTDATIKHDIRSRYKQLQSQREKHNSLKYVSTKEATLSPVILVPGDGGSRLQAKLDRNEVPHYYCEKKSGDWFDLWLNLSLLVPFALDCWTDNMKLVYNATSRKTNNPPGVDIRVSGFGRTESVEFVDPAKVPGTGYFDILVKQLVALGYEKDINIAGAPYDFRKAPNELGSYFKELTLLVEQAYAKNANEKVVIICHSMGCYNILYFFNTQVNQTWKNKHIRSMISLSGVYGGSVKAIKAFASGDNFGVVVVPSLQLRKDFRTFPSLAWLLPSNDIWPDDKVLVEHGDQKYTVNDYNKFFNDIDYPNGYQMWLDTKNLTSPSKAPGVEVHCLHGHGVNTMDSLSYSKTFPDGQPKIEYGDGDGTVNLSSLQACTNWSKHQNQTIHHANFHLIDHMTIMSDPQVLNYIGDALIKN